VAKKINKENVKNQKKALLAQAWAILSCGWAFYLYEYILRVSPTVITNELMSQFNITAFTVGSLASFYYWSYVPMQIPCGVIVDRLGPRKVVTFSTILCVLGTILFSQSDSLTIAYIGRFIVGAGSACAYLSCLKVASDWFKPSYFPLIVGASMMMGTLGGIFGSKPFAILVNDFGWRHAMLIAAAIGAIIGVICWFVMHDKVDEKQKSKETELLIGIKNISRKSQNWLIGLYGCLVYIPLAAFADLWGVPYFMKRYGLNNEAASTGTIVIYLGIALGCLATAALSKKLRSRKRVMSFSSTITFLGFVAALHFPGLSYNEVLCVLFITGIASGLSILYFAVAKESNSLKYTATTVGFINALVMICPIIFQPLLGGLIDYSWGGSFHSDGTPAYSLEDYSFALSAVLFGLLLSRILVFFIHETYTNTQEA
jgi:MFS family permease